MSYINDKTVEVQAAVNAGNPERAAEVLVETLLENDATLGQTIAAMTNAAQQQRG
ncbi:hypothetical protein [Streptomyces sp. B21-083]|uniref:hypothetical protein n=1 Tax=Streptomyces sp. B21-083 TaxID=3039410 RepID=UPI002FF121DB